MFNDGKEPGHRTDLRTPSVAAKLRLVTRHAALWRVRRSLRYCVSRPARHRPVSIHSNNGFNGVIHTSPVPT